MEHVTPADDLVKVTIALTPTDWHAHASETMWAQPAGHNLFVLRNVPFFAYGFSYDDTVTAPLEGDLRRVLGVSSRGGHSTYRIFVTNTEALLRFDEFWSRLSALSCTLERATERLIAIDVPPSADIQEAYKLLQAGETAGVWDFEEAHVGHTVRHQSA